MARDVSPAFCQQFESEVHQAYQEEGGKLVDTVRTKMGVKGESVSFPIYGKGAATDRGASASDVPTMGTGATTAKVTLVKKIAADYSDVFDEAQLNFDDRQELATCIGYAMRRCEDQMIIDALEASKTTKEVPNTMHDGATAGPLVLAAVRRAAKLLNDDGVSNKGRFFLYTPGGLDSLLEDQKVGSVDYNNTKALVDGDIDTFMGFKFVMIADESITTDAGAVKTGLPGIGTLDRVYFAYHKKAVGYGNAIDKTVMADWVPQKASYLVQSHLLAGAIELDKEGIVKVVVKESA